MNSIDVIVLCQRDGGHLGACVRSVLAQQQVDLRVLIIDDASPGDTALVADRLCQADPRVEVRRHAHSVGRVASCNEGIAWAQALCLTILSEDDLLLPGALARATALISTDSEVGFCFGEAPGLGLDGPLREDPTGIGRRSAGAAHARVIDGYEFVELSRQRACINFVPAPTVVVRTALQQRVGDYRPELSHGSDLALWLRLAAHGSVGYLPDAQAICRRSGTSVSAARDSLTELLQRQATIESFCHDCASLWPWMPGLRQRLLKPLGREAVRAANAAFNGGDLERMARLLALAHAVDRDIEGSFAWFALACKRRIGKRAWRAVAPALSRLRGVMSRAAF